MDHPPTPDHSWAAQRHMRLPTLQEVLSRSTLPPVDLFMFYLFLQREGSEDVLDFWLDVQQHENLCRAYFKDIRKSGRSVKEDWPQFWEYARRRGSIYGTVVGANPGIPKQTATPEATAEREEKAAQEPYRDAEKDDRFVARSPSRSLTPFSLGGRFSLGPKRASRAPTVIPRSAAITKADLTASAERIYFRYLSPPPLAGDTSHEIYLPPTLRIHSFPLSSAQMPVPDSPGYEGDMNHLAQIPDMYHQQKEYCFRALEQDAFPRFLRAKAFGNLTPVSALVRLVAGLVVLWIALATAFALIFLDVQPKSKRFFLFIPFTLAILLLLSHQYTLDPILALLRQSETTPFRTLRIREPYVSRLLLGRATWVLVCVAAIVTALTLLFWAVPGHRL